MPELCRNVASVSPADKSATLQLKDVEGHNRLILRVAPSGEPSIQMLDAEEHVVKEWNLKQ